MEELVRGVIESYERAFGRCLTGEVGVDEVARLFTGAFFVAGRSGVTTGDREDFEEGMAENFAIYRQRRLIGKRMKEMRVTPIDQRHSVASVTWTFIYQRPDGEELHLDGDIHYLVQVRDGEAKIFGWIPSGDHSGPLREHWII